MKSSLPPGHLLLTSGILTIQPKLNHILKGRRGQATVVLIQRKNILQNVYNIFDSEIFMCVLFAKSKGRNQHVLRSSPPYENPRIKNGSNFDFKLSRWTQVSGFFFYSFYGRGEIYLIYFPHLFHLFGPLHKICV